jgi:ribonuclease BN (tRNA processing enzyme)
MKIIFHGCGDAFGSGGRFHTCFHVTGQEVNFLVDCGASSMIAMRKAAVDVNAVQAIFVTHFHADHFGGIPFFILDAQFFSKRTKSLAIVGPPGLRKWYERVLETSFPGSSKTVPKFPLHLHELAAGDSALIGAVTVRAAQAVHGNPGGPFHSLRLSAEGQTIAYTGDTEWSDELLALADGVDLFIAEAYFAEKKLPLHLDVASLTKHANALRAKRIVLTHMSNDVLSRRAEMPYECAFNGMTIDLGERCEGARIP